MKSPVRPELTTASVVRRQATPAAVDNSASLQTHPMALIYRGMSVQINRATSKTRFIKVVSNEIYTYTGSKHLIGNYSFKYNFSCSLKTLTAKPSV